MRAAWRFVIEFLNCFSSLLHRSDKFGNPTTADAPKPSVPELNPEALVDLYNACREFMRKCESGEVRSRRSYTQMKAAVEKAEAISA